MFLLSIAITIERQGLLNQSAVEQLQMKVISSLRDHVTYNNEAQKKPNYFSRILSILPELRSVSQDGLERLRQLSMAHPLPAALKRLAEESSRLPF